MGYGAGEKLTFPPLKNLFSVTSLWWVLVLSTCTWQIGCQLGPELSETGAS